jgi:tRNA(Ser,Leu) C12 N-acetylase TAN1
MKSLKLIKKLLNKKSYEILKNIEIISFIKEEKLKDYINFIIDKINKDNDFSKITHYFLNLV